VVEPADDFDNAADEGWCGPLLPPDDRLWRHPSELGEHAVPVSPEALSARRSWMAATPTRAGAWSAGIVGALLATGVVLIGGHLTHLLSPPATKGTTLSVTPRIASPGVGSDSTLMATTTTLLGADPDVYTMAAKIAPAMAMVFVDHKPSGVGVVVSSKGFVLLPSSLVTDTDDLGLFIDGQQLPATVVGVDAGTGLAVVRVHAMNTLTSISFVPDTGIGDGSFVALVWVDGNGTHTCWGSVSSLDVSLTSSGDSPPILEALSTLDSPSGVANGGVIIDGAGQLAGMITGSSGKALIATPGWLAKVVSGDLIAAGRVIHGWLGITGETASLSAYGTAVKVVSVSPGGAAAKAGVKQGDMIEAVNGEPTRTMSDMVAALYSLAPDQAVVLNIDRHGHTWDARARLTAAA